MSAMRDIMDSAARLKLVIFDVDGVLTDGGLILGDKGEEFKVFYSRDGHGMKMLKNTGVEIAIITGRESQIVAQRMASLGIKHVYQGQDDKLPAFDDLLQKLELDASEVAYVGDDVVDLPILLRTGLAIAVADAHPLVAKHAHWQTPHPGGRGAARDVCELIMEAKGDLHRVYQQYVA